jgi:hypothetical protein
MNVTGGRYDQNVTRLVDDYPDFSIRGGFEGVGYQAQKRLGGLQRGKAICAMSLDELAVLMDRARDDGDDRIPRGDERMPG